MGEQSSSVIDMNAEPIQTTYRVADAHAHIYPEKIAEKATESVGKFYGVHMAVEEGTSDALLVNGSKIGCEKYLVCSVATTLKQVPSITEFIAGECAKHPEFIGLGAYHQEVEDPAALLDRVEELGLRGIKIHPDFQRFNIDDPAVMPLYKELAKRDMPILIHMGDNRYDYSAPRRLMNVLEEVPDLTALAAHFGGYRAWDKAEAVLHGTNVYYDTSSSLWWLSPEHANELVHHYGVERMMFGVDYPMWNHAEEFRRFMALGLTEEENKAVLYDNFARLFKLDDAS